MDSDQELILTQTENIMTKKRRNQLNAECQSSRVLQEVLTKQKKELQSKVLTWTADGLMTADEGMHELNKFDELENDIRVQFRMDLDLEDHIN